MRTEHSIIMDKQKNKHRQENIAFRRNIIGCTFISF